MRLLTSVFLVAWLAASAWGAACSNTGTLWSTATWTCGHTPISSDDATLTSSMTIDITASVNSMTQGAFPITINTGVHYTVGAGGTTNAVASGHAIDIPGGAWMTLNGNMVGTSNKLGDWYAHSSATFNPATLTWTGSPAKIDGTGQIFYNGYACLQCNVINWQGADVSGLSHVGTMPWTSLPVTMTILGSYIHIAGWVGADFSSNLALVTYNIRNSYFTAGGGSGSFVPAGATMGSTIYDNTFMGGVNCATTDCVTSYASTYGGNWARNYMPAGWGEGLSTPATNSIADQWDDNTVVVDLGYPATSQFLTAPCVTGRSIKRLTLVAYLVNSEGIADKCQQTLSGVVIVYPGYEHADTGAGVFGGSVGTTVADGVIADSGLDYRAIYDAVQAEAQEGFRITARHVTMYAGSSAGGSSYNNGISAGHSQPYSTAFLTEVSHNLSWSGGVSYFVVGDHDNAAQNIGACLVNNTTNGSSAPPVMDNASIGTGQQAYNWGNHVWSTSPLGTCNVGAACGYSGAWASSPCNTTDKLNFDYLPQSLEHGWADFPLVALGMTAGAGEWNSGTAYNLGDVVTVHDATIWGGKFPVMLRCMNAGGCPAGPTHKPGVDYSTTDWQSGGYWQWETDYLMSVLTPKGQYIVNSAFELANDSTHLCTNSNPCSIGQAYYNWVFRLHEPQNLAACRSADGGYVGAAQCRLAPAMLDTANF